tara:strand:- start:155 stop:343 length:189 start_codon:yes stop_codon:yes gene_type:complete
MGYLLFVFIVGVIFLSLFTEEGREFLKEGLGIIGSIISVLFAGALILGFIAFLIFGLAKLFG